MAQVHHSAITTSDVEASIRFWRDGLGFEVLMDHQFEGPWPELFGASTTTLRSVFLGEASAPQSGVVELVGLDPLGPRQSTPSAPAEGFFLLSLLTDLDVTLARLADLGLGGDPTVASVSGVRLAVVHDPNGVAVELMDDVARRGLEGVTGAGSGKDGGA